MRASSTSSPSRAPASAAAAPPVVASAPESASHSACQAPARALVLLASESRSTEAWPRARAAPARVHIAPTGLRLCGIAEEPPASPPSRTSPTSVCASSMHVERRSSRARPPRSASAAPSSATRTRFVCQGTVGSARPSSSAKSVATSSPRSPSADQRPGRSAELRREASIRELAKPRTCVEHCDEPARGLEPERRRYRLLQQRPARHRRVPVRSRRASRRRPPTPSSSASTSAERSPGDQHRRRVHHVLARRRRGARTARAPRRPVRRAPGRAAPPACRRARASTSSCSQSYSSAEHAAAIAAAASAGTTPAAAPALASARSASSIAPSHARPETASCSGAGTNSGSKGVTPRRMSCAAAPCKRMSNRRPPSSATATSVSRRSCEDGTARDRPRSPPPRPGSRCA